MNKFIVLKKPDMLTLCRDEPVIAYIGQEPYVLCTEKYFERQKEMPQLSLGNNETIETPQKICASNIKSIDI